MKRFFYWVVLILGVIIFFSGVIIVLSAQSFFDKIGAELDALLVGMFSRMLELEMMGQNMQEQWNSSLMVFQVIGIVAMIFGIILSVVGLASLLSRDDDWQRR